MRINSLNSRKTAKSPWFGAFLSVACGSIMSLILGPLGFALGVSVGVTVWAATSAL